LKNQRPDRLLSLDTVRGLTIAGMILVNCPGNDTPYPFLAHADWDGWTFADLIFPAFLVIMGVSLAISLGRRLEQGDEPFHVLGQTFRRSAIIFALGLVISAVMVPRLGVFRIPGVLQRIAVCNFVCAYLFLHTKPRTQILAALGLVTLYSLLMMLVPVPGYGAGVLTPDGNLASYVDRLVFGGHMWVETHDPEGVISTLPAVATTLMGVFAGAWLRSKARRERQAEDIAAAGAVSILLGLLCSHWIPINKNIWSSSFTLFTGGVALCALALCHWLIESRGFRAWGVPFEVFGRNALASFFLSEMFYGVQEFIHLPGRDENIKEWLTAAAFGSLSPQNAALGYSLCYLAFCFGVMSIFYRKRVFIKV
jgi:predicted acyltransferase